MELQHIIDVSRYARNLGPDFPGTLSRGEAATAALVLNRADYLKAMDYTMAEAVNRLDQGDAAKLIDAQRALQREAPLVEV